MEQEGAGEGAGGREQGGDEGEGASDWAYIHLVVGHKSEAKEYHVHPVLLRCNG
jgi:hypothetical protein